MKQIIGILVSQYLFNKILMQIETHECISFYEEACDQYELTPCFLRLVDLARGKEYIKALVKGDNGKYSIKLVKTPMIIHNRALLYHKQDREKVMKLQEEGFTIFNGFTKIPKLTIHQHLVVDEKLKPYLPDTRRANKNNFVQMIKEYRDLIIKPDYGTLGKGVARVILESNNICLLKNGQIKYRFLLNGQWGKEVNDMILNPTNIIQQTIPLRTYEDKPFDFRVSVQRNDSGTWQVTGIVSKVAKSGQYITNVASGGKCYDPKIVLNHLNVNPDQVLAEIESMSLMIANHLGERIKNLADLGLDIGITGKGVPMFIECNFRDLRITFKEAGLIDEWKATYTTPVKYATYLLKNK